MKHILIVRPGAIGDTLLTLPLLQALRARYAPGSITFVGNSAVLPFLLASGLVDVVESYDDIVWSQLFVPVQQQRDGRFLNMLRQFDTALCWLRDRDGLVRHNLRAAGIQQAMVAPGRPEAHQQVHIVDYLLRCSGLSSDDALVWHMPEQYAWQAESVSLSSAERALVIHPGSGGKQKCWPVEYFATVIQSLSRQGMLVLVLSGPAEEERLQALYAHLEASVRDQLRVFVCAPLLHIAQLLPTCRGYLGNDSGLTHLAALAGVPTVALFGPSDPAVWHPLGPRVHVVHKELLSEITPEYVLRLLP